MKTILLSPYFKMFYLFIGICVMLAGLQMAQIMYYSKKIAYNVQPFQKINSKSNYKVLFAGDSTAVGTGVTDITKSTAGWFSRDFPEASIENHSQNGLKLKGMIEILSGLQDRRYNLAVLQIGANDIIGFTDLKDVEMRLQRVIELSKNIADDVIILHSGNVGEAPLFHWPFTWIYTWRTLKVRAIYIKNQDKRATYVDIYQLEKKVKDPHQKYSSDNLHLNEEGYHTWYKFIKTEIKSTNS